MIYLIFLHLPEVAMYRLSYGNPLTLLLDKL